MIKDLEDLSRFFITIKCCLAQYSCYEIC